MKMIRELKVQYITDDAGQKTGVILPIEEFEGLLEDMEDLAIVAERRDETTTSHEDVLSKLKNDGILPD